MRYTYQHNGQTYTVELETQPDGRYQARVEGRIYTVQVMPLTAGGWHLQLISPQAQDYRSGNVESHRVYCEAQGDKRFVSLEGVDYTLVKPDQRVERRRPSASGGDLSAQMPGQVVNVLVAEGDAVERGQTLVILEAMKMEIRIAAPEAGRVKRMLVQTGQVVERGQALLEIEAET